LSMRIILYSANATVIFILALSVGQFVNIIYNLSEQEQQIDS